jgi:hypothetical protein
MSLASARWGRRRVVRVPEKCPMPQKARRKNTPSMQSQPAMASANPSGTLQGTSLPPTRLPLSRPFSYATLLHRPSAALHVMNSKSRECLCDVMVVSTHTLMQSQSARLTAAPISSLNYMVEPPNVRRLCCRMWAREYLSARFDVKRSTNCRGQPPDGFPSHRCSVNGIFAPCAQERAFPKAGI